MPVGIKMPRHRLDIMPLPERIKLGQMMLAYMLKIGAVKTHEFVFDDKPLGNKSYEFKVETPHGELRIMFESQGHVLFCRFMDPDRACLKLNPRRDYISALNPVSGKYNVYTNAEMTAEQAFHECYGGHLRRALAA